MSPILIELSNFDNIFILKPPYIEVDCLTVA